MRFFSALAFLICTLIQVAKGQLNVVKIHIDPKIPVARISSNFIGLGYETAAVAQTDYFNSQNTTLINLYQNLNPHGLIRIGGNISDHTRYVPEGISAVRTEKGTTVIDHEDLKNLAAFAHATGWEVMWGLNLGTGSKEQAVQEAKAVKAALGEYLQSFQIGNEVDLQHLYNKKYKNFNAYYSDYEAYRAAVRTALPHTPFSGPDVAGNLKWLKAFANKEAKDIKLLTYHYYRTGSRKPEATLKTLLGKDTAWSNRLAQLQRISQHTHVPFRINEVNSFYGGGKEGVSDTFGSALWCLDYMFLLASYGCNGVNMETGINQLGWISHYSPIVHDSAGNCSVRPEYYGMLAFALAGKGSLLKTVITENNINLSAYSTKSKGGPLWLTIINKDLSRDAKAEVSLPEAYTETTVYRLEAPSVKSMDRVTLGGAKVSASGKWHPGPLRSITVRNGEIGVSVPHASAILLCFREREK